MLSFVPASCEIIGYILFAPVILGLSHIEAAVMGAVLALSHLPFVIPRMVQLMETKYGTEKAIPQMIMAGASCDDIFVIVLFTSFLNMSQGAVPICLLLKYTIFYYSRHSSGCHCRLWSLPVL